MNLILRYLMNWLILVDQALTQARAGATIIAPSDMMDGRVGGMHPLQGAELDQPRPLRQGSHINYRRRRRNS